VAALSFPNLKLNKNRDTVQSELEAETRRLDYDFFDQLDCLDPSDLSRCYEDADGAD